jgi:hypothetical protein
MPPRDEKASSTSHNGAREVSQDIIEDILAALASDVAGITHQGHESLAITHIALKRKVGQRGVAEWVGNVVWFKLWFGVVWCGVVWFGLLFVVVWCGLGCCLVQWGVMWCDVV